MEAKEKDCNGSFLILIMAVRTIQCNSTTISLKNSLLLTYRISKRFLIPFPNLKPETHFLSDANQSEVHLTSRHVSLANSIPKWLIN